MAGYPWIKLHTELLDDDHLAELSNSARWRYIQLQLVAGRCNADGYLAEDGRTLTVRNLAWRLHSSEEALQPDLDALTAAGYLALENGAYLVTAFAERQRRPGAWQSRREPFPGEPYSPEPGSAVEATAAHGAAVHGAAEAGAAEAGAAEAGCEAPAGQNRREKRQVEALFARQNLAEKGGKTSPKAAAKPGLEEEEDAELIGDGGAEGEGGANAVRARAETASAGADAADPNAAPGEAAAPAAAVAAPLSAAAAATAAASAARPPFDDPVRVSRRMTRANPSDEMQRRIRKTVDDPPRWQATLEHWIDHGWNPHNLTGQLDLYRRGGPAACRSCAKAPPGSAATVDPIDELIAEYRREGL